jgi:hypothetical protein
VENIINSKILHQSVDKGENSKTNIIKDQSHNKIKVNIKPSSKMVNNLSTKVIAIKEV